MNLRMIFTALLVMIWTGMSAQSPAAQVKEIQKNTAGYISAESTDPSEEAAYGNAMRQMIDMARNFVSTNNNGAGISDGAIEAVVKKIVIPRGDFKRVFVYAKRDDLLEKSGENITADKQPEAVDEEPVRTEPAVQENNFEEVSREMIRKESNPQQPSTIEPAEEDEADEDIDEVIPQEIVAEVGRTAKVSAATKELIGILQQAKSLPETIEILERYKTRRTVSDYGVARQAHNSAACYWVVEDNGQITVLGPEVRGHRNNFRTGKTDALHRYTNGIWFRKR